MAKINIAAYVAPIAFGLVALVLAMLIIGHHCGWGLSASFLGISWTINDAGLIWWLFFSSCAIFSARWTAVDPVEGVVFRFGYGFALAMLCTFLTWVDRSFGFLMVFFWVGVYGLVYEYRTLRALAGEHRVN